MSARALLFGGVLAATGCAAFARTPADGFVTPTAVMQVRWRRHLTEEPLIEYKPQEFAAAAVRGEGPGALVYIGSSAGVFYALRGGDGSVVWNQKLGAAIGSRPLWVPELGAVLVGARDGGLYAFDARTGAQRWVYRARGVVDTQPAYADGVVYFTSGENRVYALDATRGTWKWQYDREPPESFTIRGHGAPLVYAGQVYVGFSDGYLASLSAATGEVSWARSLAGEATRFTDVDATPIVRDGVLYVSSFAGGVHALDPKDGGIRWRFPVEGAGTVRIAGGRVYFSAAKYGLHALDLEGNLVWRQALAEGGELSTPWVVDGYVLVSSARGGTYVADAESGRLFQYFAPGHGVTAEPISDGKQVYLLSNGGYFYGLSLRPRATL